MDQKPVLPTYADAERILAAYTDLPFAGKSVILASTNMVMLSPIISALREARSKILVKHGGTKESITGDKKGFQAAVKELEELACQEVQLPGLTPLDESCLDVNFLQPRPPINGVRQTQPQEHIVTLRKFDLLKSVSASLNAQ